MASAAAAAEDPHFFVELADKSHALLLPFGVNKDQSIFLQRDHSPKLDALPKLVAEGGYTSIVLMSHGWNTTPYDGRAMYKDWFSNLQAVNAAAAGGKLGAKPLYIGIYWPSIILAPTWESYIANPKIVEDATKLDAKQIAARIAEASDKPEDAERIERALTGGERGVLEELMNSPPVALDSDEVLPTLASLGNDAVKKELKTAVEGKALNQMVPSGSPPLASLAQNLTLGPMKKLSGEIGASKALQAFLKEQAFASGVPVHLQGHSLGCKVMLEAVANYTRNNPGGPRPRSLTLIQVGAGD